MHKHKKHLSIFVKGSSLLIFLLFLMVLNGTAAQTTPYTAEGTIGIHGCRWLTISNVKQNDLLLISISGSSNFNSALFYPNQTQANTFGNTPTHSYHINAEVDGTYNLLLTGAYNYNSTYSASCSHEITNTDQVTPYKADGLIGLYGSVWLSISDVKQNDLVLVSVTGSENFNSVLYYPDQSEVGKGSNTPIHFYHFFAKASGTYSLSFTGAYNYNSTYSAASSHNFVKATVTPTPQVTITPIVTPTLTITPLVTPSVTPTLQITSNVTSTPDLKMEATTGGAVTFEVPSGYSSGGNFVWDFGDGTITSTNNTSTTHIYNQAGNFTVKLMISNGPTEKPIQSILVTVNPPKDEGEQALWSWLVPLIAAGISAIVTTALYFKKRNDDRADRAAERALGK